MILLDANLLLYAWDASATHHERARTWLEAKVSEGEPVRVAWVTILAFIRIATNFRGVQQPMTPLEACQAMSSLLDQPSVEILDAGPRHWGILARLIDASGSRGALIMNAHLAALALEHGAILCTHDRDFLRFDGLRVEFPLSA